MEPSDRDETNGVPEAPEIPDIPENSDNGGISDREIVELFFRRDERAIYETAKKYGRLLLSVAVRITGSREDGEECVNDTYVGAWGAIPPARPAALGTFLCKITRRLSLKAVRGRNAEKRGGGTFTAALDELAECVPAPTDVEEEVLKNELSAAIDRFLSGMPETERKIFVCRYWYFDGVAEIAERFGFGESRVKMTLLRTREKLRRALEKEFKQ